MSEEVFLETICPYVHRVAGFRLLPSSLDWPPTSYHFFRDHFTLTKFFPRSLAWSWSLSAGTNSNEKLWNFVWNPVPDPTIWQIESNLTVIRWRSVTRPEIEEETLVSATSHTSLMKPHFCLPLIFPVSMHSIWSHSLLQQSPNKPLSRPGQEKWERVGLVSADQRHTGPITVFS